MWLSKPLYESIPFYYVAAGIAALLAGLYVDYWYWSLIFTVVGVASLVVGLAVWLKRRDYRSSRSRIDFEKTE
jgi:membrane protein implicated in regulation of membrane protease activity